MLMHALLLREGRLRGDSFDIKIRLVQKTYLLRLEREALELKALIVINNKCYLKASKSGHAWPYSSLLYQGFMS